MRWLLVLLLWSGSLLLAQDAACRSPLGVPCYTIRGTQTNWQAFREGFTDVHRFRMESTRALRRDGSNVMADVSSEGGWFGTDPPMYKVAAMYLAPERSIVTLDFNSGTVARREPLIWHDLPYRRSVDGDSACRSGIVHFGGDFEMAGTATVAGVPVVKWRRSLGNGSEEQYLAPSLDCVPLKSYTVQRNDWWIPTLVRSWEASSVQLGEPAAELFAVPAGYRQVVDPRRKTLIRFLESNQGRGAVR